MGTSSCAKATTRQRITSSASTTELRSAEPALRSMRRGIRAIVFECINDVTSDDIGFLFTSSAQPEEAEESAPAPAIFPCAELQSAPPVSPARTQTPEPIPTLRRTLR